MNTNEIARLHRIFDFVVNEVGSAGGDGDGVVVFYETDIDEAANLFVKWMKAHEFLSTYPFKRMNIGASHVLFYRGGNENITFTSNGNKINRHWREEVWLEVW
jgi:hypothetical protein